MDQVGQIIINFPSKGQLSVQIKGNIDARRLNSMSRAIAIEHRRYIQALRKQRAIEQEESARTSISIPKPASEASLSHTTVVGGATPKGVATTTNPFAVPKVNQEPEPESTVPILIGGFLPEEGDELIIESDNEEVVEKV